MQLWWEVHEKFMDELESHTTFEGDDNFEKLVKIDNTYGKKKKNKKKSKSAEKEDL